MMSNATRMCFSHASTSNDDAEYFDLHLTNVTKARLSKSAPTTNETRFMKIRFKPRNMIELCGGENVSDTCKLEKEIKKPEKYHPM